MPGYKDSFKTVFVLWPKRLIWRRPTNQGNDWIMVGWVWMRRAHLVKNLSHGWVAFVEDQTPENLQRCPSCNRPL